MEGMRIIYERYPDLTTKQQSVVDYLLAHPDDACYVSLKELSRRTGVSEVSVLRTCAALGFDGYVRLKEAFRRYTPQIVRGMPAPWKALDDIDHPNSAKISMLQNIRDEEIAKLAKLSVSVDPEYIFAEARDLLAAEEVVIFAHDVTKVFADYFFHRLTFLHIKASSVMLGENSTVQSILGRMKHNDHAIVFSFPPYFLPTMNTAKYAQRHGVNVTVITDSADSPAIVDGSRVFLCDTSTRFFYNSYTPIPMLINMIASCAAMEMGEKYDSVLAEEQVVAGFMLDGRPIGEHAKHEKREGKND